VTQAGCSLRGTGVLAGVEVSHGVGPRGRGYSPRSGSWTPRFINLFVPMVGWASGEPTAKSPVPIATGEGLLPRYDFEQLLDERGAQIIQPDVVKFGGITEIRKIAELAKTYNIEVAPHQPYGQIAHVASIHAMSRIRNFLIHEWQADDEALCAEVTRGTFPVQRDGVTTLPEAPGLGIEMDFAELVRQDRNLRFPAAKTFMCL